MQRAPVFIFDSAREARDFCLWIEENIDEVDVPGPGQRVEDEFRRAAAGPLGRHRVGEIAEAIGVSLSNASQHLAVLQRKRHSVDSFDEARAAREERARRREVFVELFYLEDG